MNDRQHMVVAFFLILALLACAFAVEMNECRHNPQSIIRAQHP
jgi:hypothetical protein